MKKFLLTILTVLLFVCLGSAVACAGDGDGEEYYTLVFKKTNGVTYVCDVPSGWEVKGGTTVEFSISLSDDATGTAVVYANSDVLTADGEGKYSVTVNENTVVRVDGITAKGDYNKIIFASGSGVSYNIRNENLLSGMLVRMGTVVRFSIVIGADYTGTPRVYANSTELTATDGVYSFEMNEPTTVSVDGITKVIDVTYVSADTRVRYIDQSGDFITTDTVSQTIAGDVAKFKVKISVYHVQSGYSVLANQTILNPDSEGYYTTELTDDTEIKVTGLQEETSFLERSDGGSGTERDPFLLTRPIDLYQMAMQINSGWHTDGLFYNGHYKLGADIDLDGEQLYVIGDGTADSGYAFFSGTFDGDGHTVSNYYISDEWVEQENYQRVKLTSVGFFGTVTSTSAFSPSIYNLNLENFRIIADASEYSAELSVGGLIGNSFGVSVVGCSLQGTIEVTGGATGYGAYVGGVIGQQISAYSTTSNINYFSTVRSTTSNVNINSNGDNFVYAAGGISGLLAVGDESLTSSIVNCYTEGDINGSLNAGGIVGYAGPATSVENCYSTGDITAYSPFGSGSGYSEELFYANAGGVVGRVGFNSVVSGCFSTGDLFASSAAASRFAKTGAAVGMCEEGIYLQDAHAYKATVYGCPDTQPDSITETYIRDTMHWDEEDWTFSGGKPTINTSSSSKTFTLTFSADSEFGSVPEPFVIDSVYSSMSRWYMMPRDGIAEYVDGTGTLRSYGYFFDAEKHNRIPLSFVPTGNMTVYIGYADYGEVAGTYYLGESADLGAKLDLGADGTLAYINGAIYQQSLYNYDGQNIVLLGSYLGELSPVLDSISDSRLKDYYLSSMYNFGATVADGKISVTGGYVQEMEYRTQSVTDVSGNPTSQEVLVNTGETFNLFEAGSPLTGLEAVEGFNYTDYFDGSSTIYTFNGNGTGVRKTGETVTNFTYTFADVNKIKIKYSGETSEVDATYSNGYVTLIDSSPVNPYDGFTGAWELPFAYNVTYTFDGKSKSGTGTWTRKGYGATVESSGTYTVDTDGVLKDSGNAFEAKINNGLLEITPSGQESRVYYRGGSLVGEWYYSQRTPGSNMSAVTINLVLNGIDSSGLGKAKAEYTADNHSVDLSYQAVENDGEYTLYFYNSSTQFAVLAYNTTNRTLSGTLQGRSARLTAYDGLLGTWITDNNDITDVQFNGKGFYDLAGDSSMGALAVRSAVWVNGKSAGKYTLDYATMKGQFSYSGKIYSIEYNPDSLAITIKESGNTINLYSLDFWYTHKLGSEDGYVYTFDGRGEHSTGKVVASNGTPAEERQYTYTYDSASGEITLTSTETSLYKGGKISKQNREGKEVFVFDVDDAAEDIILTYSTPFEGQWIIGGEMGELQIGKVYADGKATGSYKFHNDAAAHNDVEFTYNLDGNYLTFSYEEQTYYVNALGTKDNYELSVGPENSISGSSNSICIPRDKADDYFGKDYSVYNAETKSDSGEKLVFDGLSASEFGYGTVVLYSARNTVSAAYVYSVDAHGYPLITYGYSQYCMIPCEKDADIPYTVLYYVHDAENNYYAIVYPDALYNVTVKDADNSSITYEFNGVGQVICRNPAASGAVNYRYSVLLADNVKYRHILQFTDAEDKVYSVVLDQSSDSSDDWTLKISEADAYFGIAAKDADSETAEFLFDGAGGAIRLTSSADEVTVYYTYELVSADGNTVTFTFREVETGAEFTAVLDMSGDRTLRLTEKA